MNIPFGDLKLHYQSIKPHIDTAVARTLESGYYILGDELKSFERNFADYLGAKFVVGCGSGTEAIYLALASLGVKTGDEVITVAHTAVPTISAISMTGAEPVFVDIDPQTYLMDLDAVEKKLTKNTKAIVPVHLYGQMVDMAPLMKLALQRGIPIVEDVAQAAGASFNSQKAGTIGELGAFSFYPSKNIGAFGDGGAVSTDCEERYQKLLRLRNYGQSKRYYHDEIGINSRLDEIQAAILGAQLPFLTGWNKRRREIADRYTEGLSNVVATPIERQHHVYHLYVIQCGNRDGLQSHLAQRGIGSLIHYPVPAHLQKAYLYRGYKRGDLPATEFVAGRILSLPMYPQLTDEQVDLIIHEVRQYIKLNPAARATTKDYFQTGNLAAQSNQVSIGQ